MSTVTFYKANERPFGVFSNLYRCEMWFEGRLFLSSEHAYQFGKPRDDRVREWLMDAPTPALLAKTAHQLNRPWEVVPGWSKIKVERMRKVLEAKFEQYEGLRDLLLSTGDKRIVEAGTIDDAPGRFWGEVNGQGKNTLGVLLMEIRNALKVATPKG